MQHRGLVLGVAGITASLLTACGAEQAPAEEITAIDQALIVGIPTRIEAENYERAGESTAQENSGNQCDRNDGVDKELTTDPNGGNCNIGWTAAGEWLEWDLSAPVSGTFSITARVASEVSARTFSLTLDGKSLGTLTSPSSGWQAWEDRTYHNVAIPAGNHTLRMDWLTGDVNLNYIDVQGNAANCAEQKLNAVSAVATSVETNDFPAAFAIDNNPQTRWASLYSDPQSIYLDLGAPRRVRRVVLNWEVAASASYELSVSDNANGPWQTIYTASNADGGVDDIAGLSAVGRYVRMYSHARTTQWGNSLWEFEVYGNPDPNCSTTGPSCNDRLKNGSESDVDCGGSCSACENGKLCAAGSDCQSGLCLNGICQAAPSCTDGIQNGNETGVDCGGSCQPCASTCVEQALPRAAALASSEETSSYASFFAIDGNTSTRWSSLFSDPQWLYVDLGTSRRVSRVLLNWEAAASRSYEISISDNPSGPWHPIYNTSFGDGGLDDITGLSATGRYVRMYSHSRTTEWGNSLWEFEVYGDPNPDCDTSQNDGDTDNDRLSDAAETNTGVFVNASNTGTNPNNPDTDGDGILDGDEVLGTQAGLNLPALGASPLRKNILLEYDWFDDSLDCGFHSHRPNQAIFDRLEQAFARAPVPNPDGSTGITLINDFGQGGVFSGGNKLNDADGVLGGYFDSEYYDYKNANFAANRLGYFHYVILPHRYATDSSSSGLGEIVGDDMIVSLYCANSDDNVGNTIMHELGHNLGLLHGGMDGVNYKSNYNSVMNYSYQFPGVDNNCTPPGDGVLDYSHGERSMLDENALNESIGICGGVAWDFNFSGQIEPGLISYDVNFDQFFGTLHDYNDWANIVYDFTPSGAGAGAMVPQVAVCDNPAPTP